MNTKQTPQQAAEEYSNNWVPTDESKNLAVVSAVKNVSELSFSAGVEWEKQRSQKLIEALSKLSEEMQVFLNVSYKIHFPDAREAQAEAIKLLQEYKPSSAEGG